MNSLSVPRMEEVNSIALCISTSIIKKYLRHLLTQKCNAMITSNALTWCDA